MKTSKYLLLLGFFYSFLLSSPLHGQVMSKKDSLVQRFNQVNQGRITLSTLEEINLLNDLAQTYKFRVPDSLNYFAQKALYLNSPVVSKKAKVLSNIYLGGYYSDRAEKEKASLYFSFASEEIKTLNAPKIEILLLQEMALNYFFNYRSYKWHKCLVDAIKISMDHGMELEHGILHHIKGYLFYTYNLYEEAEKEQKKAEDLFRRNNHTRLLTNVKSNLTLNALDWGKIEDFEIYSKETLDLLEQYPNPLWSRRTYYTIAKYHLGMENFKEAYRWNSKAVAPLKKVSLLRDQLEHNNLQAEIYLGLKRIDSAAHYASLAYSMASQLNDTLQLIQSQEYLSEIEKLKGKNEEAFSLLISAHETRAIYNQTAKTNRVRFLNADLQLNNLKRERREALAEKSKQQNRVMLFGFLSLVGLSVLGLQALHNRRTEQRLNKELEAKNLSKNKLFSVVSHDLVKPINILKENLALYKNNLISKKEVLGSIPQLQSEVEQSSFTLNNLLYWAQSQMSGIKSNPKQTKLKERVSISRELFSPEMQRKSLDVACEIPQELDVWFDVNHLDVVIRNMVSNAVKYTPKEGKIRFRAYDEGEHICFVLTNEGDKISPIIINFFNDKSPKTDSEKELEDTRLGVGLKVIKELVLLNDGRLKLKHCKKDGNVLMIHIPKAETLKAIL